MIIRLIRSILLFGLSLVFDYEVIEEDYELVLITDPQILNYYER